VSAADRPSTRIVAVWLAVVVVDDDVAALPDKNAAAPPERAPRQISVAVGVAIAAPAVATMACATVLAPATRCTTQYTWPASLTVKSPTSAPASPRSVTAVLPAPWAGPVKIGATVSGIAKDATAAVDSVLPAASTPAIHTE
jgi:hypothetical protein